VRERYFTKNFYIVPGRRSAFSAFVSCLIFQLQVVAFLMSEKVNGNAIRDETAMLTITVKHSFNMKSRAVLRIALLDRSKFLE
jgi:hypothetical protein